MLLRVFKYQIRISFRTKDYAWILYLRRCVTKLVEMLRHRIQWHNPSTRLLRTLDPKFDCQGAYFKRKIRPRITNLPFKDQIANAKYLRLYK